MSDDQKEKTNKPLSLSGRGRLQLNRPVETGQVRQSFSHGRSKTVAVEVKRKRTVDRPVVETAKGSGRSGKGSTAPSGLTDAERETRVRVVQQAQEQAKLRQAEEEEAARRAEEEAKREAERKAREAEERAKAPPPPEEPAPAPEATPEAEADTPQPTAAPAPPAGDDQGRAVKRGPARAPAQTSAPAQTPEDADRRDDRRRTDQRRVAGGRRGEQRRRSGKLTIAQALDDNAEERQRSLAAVRRAREREKQRQMDDQNRGQQERSKVIRDVVIPESITVQDLANRMAERAADVIKALMKSGMMVNINHVLDADTAELIVEEFGHRFRRISESDVEMGLEGGPDEDETLLSRPPVVTVMGHVDHGKTSLLDAFRKSNVAAREAGGITQHIGAYQVKTESGHLITFIDTPGHEAFTEMRSRGAKVTDIVILVVAADDSIQPQTVEAIRHAKAAEVPIVVAINKIDRPDANIDKVRTDLLTYEIQVEEMGGDVLDVPVSALKGTNLDKLEEALVLQSELMDLKANPDREAQGAVVEAQVERGRGTVATVLVQRGTLRQGDIVIAGTEWGRVRALLNDEGEQIEEAGPSQPVSVLGLQGTPAAGDDFQVIDSEARAREITEFRARKLREADSGGAPRGTLEQMFSAIKAGEAKDLPVVIKADTHGSLEAISASLEKLSNDEVTVRVLHAAAGGINESDVGLAKASQGLIVGFNVRANPQAREMASRDGIDIRYYSVIYDIINDAKALVQGMMAPTEQENFLGYAEIREVFSISKTGKVAGCRVTEGMVRRGARVRLLRDNVVVHQGALSSLRRFKDEVREVQNGYECGMAFENYQDIQVGDVIECYEVQHVAAEID